MLGLAAALALTLATAASAQTCTVLKNFTDADGYSPQAGLVLAGSTLYGTTYYGGSSSNGVVFKINTDGSGYTVLKSFAGGSDGANPYAGLVLAGSTLYGTTYYGGSSSNGVVFKINTDGLAFETIHTFATAAVDPSSSVWTNTDGAYPQGGLVVAGSTLYGATAHGGSSGNGVVFKINTDGSGFAVLKSFTGSDGAYPCGGLVLAGSTLYGTASQGTSSGYGAVFKVNTDGSGYTVLKSFTGSDGASPDAGLLLAGNTLYGTTSGGGSSGDGVVFKLNTDGSGYTVLKSFSGSDGAQPCAGLVLAGSTLYGTTYGGGSSNDGVVFSLGGPPGPATVVPCPQSQTFLVGDSVAFGVQVANIGPLGYQWVFNATNALAGATNSVLQLTNLQPAQSGAYAVILTNDYGAVTSAPAVLQVIPLATNAVSGCTEVALRTALARPGWVTFACDGTITLTSTLTIWSHIVLDGTGHRITISGGNSVQVFTVNSNVSFSAINLTIANGLGTNGGAIYNAGGTINLTNCTLVGNSACGPPSSATFSAGGDGQGGAVYNTGSLNACLCAFIGNSASGRTGFPLGGPGGGGFGGAICSLGQMTVAASTFASNSVTGGPGNLGIAPPSAPSGGAGWAGGPANGAAIFGGGVAAIVNSTFAWNAAIGGEGGGGGYGTVCRGGGGPGGPAGSAVSGQCFVSNCTLAFNSATGGKGGPGGTCPTTGNPGSPGSAAGPVAVTSLVNTLLVANLPTNGLTGSVIDTNHNLWADNSLGIIGPLADNGGPTLTIALPAGSPAIDAADTAAAPPTDQRGCPRPTGAGPDIGAYEGAAPNLVSPPQDCTIALFSTAQFSVLAAGAQPLFYQWYFNATNPLAGGPSPTLQLTNAQMSQAGAYSAVITNSLGAVTSPPAFLTVLPIPPTLTLSPTSQAAFIGSSLSFEAAATGGPPLSFQWLFDATNALPGATNAILYLTNLQPAQAGAYSVVVTNTLGAVTSAPATLTLTPPVVTNSTETALCAALAAGGTVTFAASGTITLANAAEITRDTVLDGTGQDVTISGGAARLFYVDTNVHFTLINLTIANGHSDSGAGMYNNGGVVTLQQCRFTSNIASNAGGAIYNAGALTANLCSFSRNSAQGLNGLNGVTDPRCLLVNSSPGSPAYGGALFNASGATASITGSTFDSNTATAGAGGAGANGGYYNYTAGPGPPGGLYWGPTAAAAGADASGGAIYNDGSLTLLDSTCTANAAAAGPGGAGGSAAADYSHWPWYWYYTANGCSGGGGGSACGGALYNAGVATIAASTLAGNTTAGALGGSGGVGGSGGDGAGGGSANGGALYNCGTASLVNCTLTANTSVGAAGGWGGGGGPTGTPGNAPGPNGSGGDGGSGTGGGISGPCFLTNCTLVANSAIAGLGGAGWTNGQSGSATGGGSSGATMANTLLAANSPAEPVTSGSIDTNYNLYMNTTAGVVGPLADNGGPTLTMALLLGSPAIDAADTAAAPATDQRGFPRPRGSAADIGAYEFGYPGALQAALPPGGGIDLSVCGGPGLTCRLLASPDLVHWTAIATNSFGLDGTALFHDPAPPGQTQRFYRVVMP